MRRKLGPMALSVHLLLCAAGCGVPQPAEPPPAKATFDVRVEVLESLEDGPFVVRTTLTNRGSQAVKICRETCTTFENAYLEGPASWQARSHICGSTSGCPWGIEELSPGGECSEVLRVHKYYSKIPAGKSTVRVVWPVYAAPEGQRLPDKFEDLKLLAEPTTELEVDVPAATPEHLAPLRRRLEEQLRRPDRTHTDEFEVFDILFKTRHHALAPVAWRMIEDPRQPGPTWQLIWFVAECPEVYPDLNARLARLAADPGWPAADDAFGYWERWKALDAITPFVPRAVGDAIGSWERRKLDLAPDAWRTLTEADSVWTRALTYVTFPKRCEPGWKAALLRDAGDASTPVPEADFKRMLAELDNDDFDVREQASARLARFGERVEAHLRQASQGELSAEAQRRVTEILARLKDQKQPPDCVRALEYLAAHDAPESGEILQVLAEGQPDAWLTHEAKAKLAEWRKDRGLPDK